LAEFVSASTPSLGRGSSRPESVSAWSFARADIVGVTGGGTLHRVTAMATSSADDGRIDTSLL
jgi:hypothetical protein